MILFTRNRSWIPQQKWPNIFQINHKSFIHLIHLQHLCIYPHCLDIHFQENEIDFTRLRRTVTDACSPGRGLTNRFLTGPSPSYWPLKSVNQSINPNRGRKKILHLILTLSLFTLMRYGLTASLYTGM